MTIPLDDRSTSRLHLRRVTLDDLPAITSIDCDPATNKFRPDGPPSPDECAWAVQVFVRGWEEHGMGYWTVEFEGAVVGVAGVRPIELRDRPCWNLYYRFTPAVWGQGFAVEVAREAVVVVDSLARGTPVVARTHAENAAAIRVAEKAGLIRRSELDSDGFVILARGW